MSEQKNSPATPRPAASGIAGAVEAVVQRIGIMPLAVLVIAGLVLVSFLVPRPGPAPGPAVQAAKPPVPVAAVPAIPSGRAGASAPAAAPVAAPATVPAATAAAAPASSAPVAAGAVAVRPESRNVEVEMTAKAAAEAPAAAPARASPAPAATVVQAAAPAIPIAAPAAPSKAQGTKMKIQTVKSPGGIEAWLVEEHAVPLLALHFAFDGGSAQDPAGREGLANFVSSMMDEGAGDLDAQTFQERMEEIAMRMSFSDSRDNFYGSLETLTVHRAKAVELLALAINRPRFDADAVERVRKQLVTNLAYAARNPERVAGKEWSRTAFPNHPYGRSDTGAPETVAAITQDDIRGMHKRVFARSGLKVVAVGDITAAELAGLLDQVFGALPARSELASIASVTPVAGGVQKVVEMDVPQSVAVFGMTGIARRDPDFMAAFVLNQILGGGGFASRLMEQVREKRGLAYSVYSYLQPYRSTAIFAGGVATKNEEIGQSLDVIRAELRKLAEEGPTAEELANAKSYLTGSYALRFDTNGKIASQLLAIQLDDLGVDYVDRRNGEVEAVGIDGIRRVAKRLLKTDDLIVTIVGKPKNLAGGG